MTIGQHIRDYVLPKGMTVSAAAKKLGVGRPALSNLLNDNAALSNKMAARIERAFGADASELLALQTQFEAEELSDTKQSLAVARQVPHIGTITAMDFSRWGEELNSRALFPALLRKLVAPLGDGIQKIDFPAYDQSQKPGWDGTLETTKASPWIPLGESVWEFGCNKDAQTKASDDYRKRTKNTPAKQRKKTTYVCVTPHIWDGKADWINQRKIKGDWKDVIALDANDLEHWIEHSLQAQTFMLECLDRSHEALRSICTAWSEWAAVCEPVFPHTLFKKTNEALSKKLVLWLEAAPSSPFVVQANTTQEALACIASTFISQEDAKAFSDRVVLLVDSSGLSTLRKTTTPMIVILGSPDIETKLADVPRLHHTIIARNKSLMHDDPDFAVDVLNSSDFTDALREIDIDNAEIDRLSATTGGSLTVLRRELATIPQIKRPPWVTRADATKIIASVVLLGAWDAKNDADKFILSYFAGHDDYDEIEANVASLTDMDDSPLWRIANIRGVLSKIDALAATSHLITDSDMDRFFEVAKAVLSEDDPSLDLPEDERWMASMHNKMRQHSPVLRRSIRETLTLLDMHSDNWFSHLNTNLRWRVENLIRELLSPFTARLVQAHDNDLMHYAEAAPDTFLLILETDLHKDTPELFDLLKPTSPGPFSSPSRTGLLWALEILAWNPDHYDRVVSILAKLSKIEIDDNWVNKPVNSLLSLFRCWMPQTAAPLEHREAALTKLFQDHPDTGWLVAMRQLARGSRSGSYNARPKWRTDSHGAGDPVTYGESNQMSLHALDLVIGKSEYTLDQLGELAEESHAWPEKEQTIVWEKIEKWAQSANDKDKAKLKEKIRRNIHFQAIRKNKETKPTAEGAWKAMDYLTPDSLVERHRWLFDGQWLPESMDELFDERLDWKERDRRTKEAREKAVSELYRDGGLQSLFEVTSESDSPATVAESLSAILSLDEIIKIIPEIFQSVPDDRGAQYIHGLIWRFREADEVEALVNGVFDQLSESDKVDFLRCLPFGSSTWTLAPFGNKSLRKRYWESINIRWNRLDDAELHTALEELLDANRPIMALNAASHEWGRVSSDMIARILHEMAFNHDQVATDSAPRSYEISAALEELSTRTDITEDRLIALEFAYLRSLRFDKHDFKALKNSFASNPALFVDCLIWSFKRRDNKVDEERYTSVSDEVRKSLAERSYDLLDQANILPGLHEKLELNEQIQACRDWVTEARKQAKAVSRIEICDSKMGEYFSRAPNGSDGVWPHEVAREAIETVNNEEFRNGFMVGVRNNRGVRTSMPYEGGDQERALADKYFKWAEELAISSPPTARFLKEIGEDYNRDAIRNDEDAKLRMRLERK